MPIHPSHLPFRNPHLAPLSPSIRDGFAWDRCEPSLSPPSLCRLLLCPFSPPSPLRPPDALFSGGAVCVVILFGPPRPPPAPPPAPGAPGRPPPPPSPSYPQETTGPPHPLGSHCFAPYFCASHCAFRSAVGRPDEARPRHARPHRAEGKTLGSCYLDARPDVDSPAGLEKERTRRGHCYDGCRLTDRPNRSGRIAAIAAAAAVVAHACWPTSSTPATRGRM